MTSCPECAYPLSIPAHPTNRFPAAWPPSGSSLRGAAGRVLTRAVRALVLSRGGPRYTPPPNSPTSRSKRLLLHSLMNPRTPTHTDHRHHHHPYATMNKQQQQEDATQLRRFTRGKSKDAEEVVVKKPNAGTGKRNALIPSPLCFARTPTAPDTISFVLRAHAERLATERCTNGLLGLEADREARKQKARERRVGVLQKFEKRKAEALKVQCGCLSECMCTSSFDAHSYANTSTHIRTGRPTLPQVPSRVSSSPQRHQPPGHGHFLFAF